tara:strand:- start:4508 stop:4795 length:288 start_codon:yes stop_codon:yes gene_type:complete
MIRRETLEGLVKSGEIESVEYYYDVSDNIRPLLDFLTYDVIKSISKRIEKTKLIVEDNYKPNTLSLPFCGNEYLLAINSYLAKVTNKKSTSYTSK